MEKIVYTCMEKKEITDKNLPVVFEHPEKNLSHHLSRMALKKTLHALDLDPPDNLILTENYNSIKDRPDIRCSLSHSQEYAAAVASKNQNILALGIDIELKSRKIQTKSQAYFLNDEDERSQFSDLELWSIKEACFKAASALNSNIKLLKDVTLTSHKQFTFKLAPKGSDCFFACIPDKKLFIMIAGIKAEDFSVPISRL